MNRTYPDGHPKLANLFWRRFPASLLTLLVRIMRFVRSLGRTYGHRRLFATIVGGQARSPQTIIEKVVQKYAVGLPEGKVVKAGDYVMIRPEHVMTHDNTGPVISKFVVFYISFPLTYSICKTDLNQLVLRVFLIPNNLSSPSTMTCKTGRQRTWPNMPPLRNLQGSMTLTSILLGGESVIKSLSRKVMPSLIP